MTAFLSSDFVSDTYTYGVRTVHDHCLLSLIHASCRLLSSIFFALRRKSCAVFQAFLLRNGHYTAKLLYLSLITQYVSHQNGIEMLMWSLNVWTLSGNGGKLKVFVLFCFQTRLCAKVQLEAVDGHLTRSLYRRCTRALIPKCYN